MNKLITSHQPPNSLITKCNNPKASFCVLTEVRNVEASSLFSKHQEGLIWISADRHPHYTIGFTPSRHGDGGKAYFITTSAISQSAFIPKSQYNQTMGKITNQAQAEGDKDKVKRKRPKFKNIKIVRNLIFNKGKKRIIPSILLQNVKLCSIESLKTLNPAMKDYEEIYGSEEKISPKVNMMDVSAIPTWFSSSSYASEMNGFNIDRVWNSSFNSIFKSREINFRIISDLEGLTQLAVSVTNSYEVRDLIFLDCNSSTMNVALLFFENDTQDESELTGASSIRSFGFINCEFDHSGVIEKYMSPKFSSLVAVSIVNCRVKEDYDPNGTRSPKTVDFELKGQWSDVGRRDQILRFELEVRCCGDPFGVKVMQLVNTLSNAVAISQRVSQACVNPKHTGIELKHAVNAMVTGLEERSHMVHELEFDMDAVELAVKKLFFRWLTEIDCLKTFVFNGSNYGTEEADLIRDFVKTVKSLKSVEIRSAAYFPSDKPSILSSFNGCAAIIHHLKLSGLKPISPSRHFRLGCGLSLSISFPHLRSFIIENSDISDAENSVMKYFLASKRLKLKSLELPGLQDLTWDLMSVLAKMTTGLVKLDLSRFSRWEPRAVGMIEPMDFIFTSLSKLKVLILDDLPISDYNLFGKFNTEYVSRMLQGDDPPHTSLILLQELEVLSLKNTNISNLTVRCVARFMPNVTRLNVSFTHVNINAVRYALYFNPTITIRAAGCGLDKKVFSVAEDATTAPLTKALLSLVNSNLLRF